MAVARAGQLAGEIERLASRARAGTDDDLARLRAAIVGGVHSDDLTVEHAATLTGLHRSIITGWLTHATRRN